MKQAFFQYNMMKDGSVDSIKKTGLIILDTNALLNIYRFNSDNREKFFEILNVVKDRLFLTYQSVQEFYNNRLKIIYNKSKFKEDLKQELTKKITEINNILENSNFQSENKDSCNLIKHEETLKTNIINILNKAKKEIENEIDSYKIDIDNTFINDDDPIMDKIIELFEGKISTPFTKNDLEQINKSGLERYRSGIPTPGAEDYKRNPNLNIYGDFIIWKEMLHIAKDNQKDILFVSDDRKSDWCEKFKQYDLGPRKELIKEFFDETNQKFYSITTKEFIKYISYLHTIHDTKDLQRESDLIESELSKSSLDKTLLDDSKQYSKISGLGLSPSVLDAATKISELGLSPSILDSATKISGLGLSPSVLDAATKISGLGLSPSILDSATKISGLGLSPSILDSATKISGLGLSPSVLNTVNKINELEFTPSALKPLEKASKVSEPNEDVD